jgi:protein phosphatase
MNLSQALQVITRTDPGMVRSHNEDAVFGDASQGLAILADGMGGYNAGEVASGMATTLLSTEIGKDFHEKPALGGDERAHRLLHDKIVRANTAIHQTAQNQPQYSGMGTTLVMALFHDNRVTVAHIGDSRLYRLRGTDFMQLTRDHSLLQEQIESGMISAEEARLSHNKNLVTRALGVEPQVEPEIHDFDVSPGDIYLLCSDGLNDMVSDDDIALTLHSLSANLELAGDQLIQMANDNGGRDNVSVILVRVLREFPMPRGWWARFLAWLK